MTEGSKIARAARGPWGVDLRAMLILAMSWPIASGAVHADTLLLRSGESIEGSIVDATRNSVVVRRTIGGMRQMPIREIAELRIDLAGGQSIAGSILSWTDGVHRIRVDDEVVSVRAGRVVSRVPYEEPRQSSLATPPRRAQSQPKGQTAAAPSGSPAQDTAAGRRTDQPVAAADSPAEESSAPAAAESSRPASPSANRAAPRALAPVRDPRAAALRAAGGDTVTGGRASADRSAAPESPGLEAAQATTPARPAAENPPADEAAAAGRPASRSAERAGPPESTPAHGGVAGGIIAKSAAAREATGDARLPEIKGSVGPVGADAAELVFKIELSRPAEQTLVLIYGTMDGTAKAGEHYESRQGILTLAPGTTSADVHVPLLEEQPRDGDTRFELFLAADPKVANIVDARVVATIPGED